MRRNRRSVWIPHLTCSTPFLACIFAALSGTSPANASQGESSSAQVNPLEIGVFGGVHFYNKTSGLGRAQDSPTGISPETGGAFGLRLSYNLNEWIGAEGEGLISPTRTRDNSTREIILGYRGQIIGTFIHRGYVRPFLLVGFGALSSLPGNPDIVPRDTDAFFHIGVGAKFPITDMLGLRLDGRVMSPPAIASRSRQSWQRNGLPWAGLGNSADRLRGILWKRAANAARAVGCQGHRRRRHPRQQRCLPDRAGSKNDDATKNGCPPAKDTDGDGIPDSSDACPTEPGPKNDDPTKNGCPPAKDTDGDGIPDSSDACPTEPGPENDDPTKNGCPREVPVAVKKFTGVIEGVTFKTDSAEITKASGAVLDKAVQVLMDYPETKIEISGHTDNVGKDEYNKELSQRRADAVKQYMLDKGIDSRRLTAVGFGTEKPISDNKTSAGRAKNRRIEFKLLAGD